MRPHRQAARVSLARQAQPEPGRRLISRNPQLLQDSTNFGLMPVLAFRPLGHRWRLQNRSDSALHLAQKVCHNVRSSRRTGVPRQDQARVGEEGGGSLPDHLPQLRRDAFLTGRQHWTRRVISVYPVQPPHRSASSLTPGPQPRRAARALIRPSARNSQATSSPRRVPAANPGDHSRPSGHIPPRTFGCRPAGHLTVRSGRDPRQGSSRGGSPAGGRRGGCAHRLGGHRRAR